LPALETDMATTHNNTPDPAFIVKAINIETKEVICEGVDGEQVIKLAKESGENYILDFESEPRYNFLF